MKVLALVVMFCYLASSAESASARAGRAQCIQCAPLTTLSKQELKECFPVGRYVTTGPGWDWKNTNGEPGIVTAPLNNEGQVRVKWQNGVEFNYCMGCNTRNEALFYVSLDC